MIGVHGDVSWVRGGWVSLCKEKWHLETCLVVIQENSLEKMEGKNQPVHIMKN